MTVEHASSIPRAALTGPRFDDAASVDGVRFVLRPTNVRNGTPSRWKKRDGAIEPFDRRKLRAGIERAVEKRDVSEETVTSLVDGIESALQDRETRIVSSSLVGELVSERLRDIDTVAYIRFVSVYRAFSEPEAFLRELDAVLDAEVEDSDPATADDRSPNT
ncbi:ATP cone domain-containing protein [Natrialba sp. INN-245]|uniref:ATP cone domain-containing protein n=1 Tax=Natrialba sp. INN-245 TaxID=2690967 RepID=UPI0031B716E6